MKEYNWNRLSKVLADPEEYRFVDIVQVDDKEAWGRKFVSGQDWYFKMHFPGNPVMPGVFIMEAIMQTGVVIVTQDEKVTDPLMMFNGCDDMRIYGEVRPGCVLETHVTLQSYRLGVAKYFGEAFVDEKRVCVMKFTLVSPKDLSTISVSLKKE